VLKKLEEAKKRIAEEAKQTERSQSEDEEEKVPESERVHR